MRALLEDLRFAARLLKKHPAFALTAVLTLVLGIVLNTAAFGVVNAIWSPLPFRDDQQIVVVRESNPAKGLFALHSYPDYVDLKAQNDVFEGLAAFSERTYNLAMPVAGAEPERVSGGMMSASTLDLLGYRPLLGRGFTSEDEAAYDTVSGPRAVLIGEGLWRNRFNADPGILGRELKIDGNRATIVGVLPYSFRFVYAGYKVLAPLPRDILRSARVDRSLQVLARVRRGTPLPQVQAELKAIAARLAAQYPASNAGWTIGATPFRRAVYAQALRMYPVLLAASALVLLIVCANLSNLLLAKTAARRRELAIRLALGASRLRLVRQIVTEGLLIAGAGAAVALVAAYWTSRILVANYPELAAFRLDHRVFAYTLFVSFGAAVVFSLAPALSASRAGLNARGATAAGYRLRGALVVSQLAFALMLLAGAGLLVKTMANLRQVDTGYDLRNLLTTQLSLEGPRYADPERRTLFWRQLTERLSALPGVEAAAMSSGTPLLAMGLPARVEVAGRPSRAGGEHVRLLSSSVDARYLPTVRIPVVAGRGFNDADRAGAPRVALVNEALARLLWPGQPSRALGQRIRTGDDSEWTTIVGVVRNARQFLMASPFPEVMAPSAQVPLASMTILVRTAAAPPKGFEQAVRREVRALDADLPIGELLAQDDILEMFYPKVMLGGLGMFSAVALALAALGLYGVISFLVNRRTQEIGVRMALGADRPSILRLVIGQGLRLAGIGIALGLAGAFALARVLSQSLYGMSASDPLVFAAVASVLALIAIAASSIPAWRAARVDPVVALRQE